MNRYFPILIVSASLVMSGTGLAGQGQGKGSKKDKPAAAAKHDDKAKKAKGTERHAADINMRFYGLDVNGDRVITRNEWRGNATSFRSHDWNGDGVLSGDEVRPGATRPARK